MKKSVLMIVILTIIFLFTMSVTLVLAQTTSGNNTEAAKINLAYQCLENKVKDKCDTLTIEQQIFSILALRYNSAIRSECKDDLIAQADKDENNKAQCWPNDRCGIKTTAQSILALSRINEDTDVAESWLINQNTTPTNLDWYLQIESNEETTCTISYGSSGPVYENAIVIGTDKKISGDAGSCLPIDSAGGSYWLRINSGSDCYSRTYTISCNKGFLTTLLYKRSGSSTVYVSDIVNSASADGETSEKINSVCFGKGGICDYEGSLWATITLDALDYDISAYIPYLTSNAADNPKLLPDAFLYILNDYPEYYGNLINLQKQSLWEVSGDKYYDTALALLALNVLDITQVGEAKSKLLTLQDSEGCWQGNIRNTAFILFSAWGRRSTIDDPVVDTSCEDNDNSAGFCRYEAACLEDGGQVLDNFECSGIAVCCSKDNVLSSCQDEGGVICNPNEICLGSEYSEVSGLTIGQTCCINGDCQIDIPDEETQCELYNAEGSCESECGENQVSTDDSCNDLSLICCIPFGDDDLCEDNSDCTGGKICKNGSCVDKPKTNIWIWILLILIILVVIGILFRNKLRIFLSRFRRGKDKTQGGMQGRTFPPRPGSPPGMIPQNRFGQGSPLSNRGMPPPQQRPMFGIGQRYIPQSLGPRPSPVPQKPIQPAAGQKPQIEKTTTTTTTKTSTKPAPKKEKDYDDVMEKLKKMSK